MRVYIPHKDARGRTGRARGAGHPRGRGALCACHVPHVIRKLVEVGSVTGFPKGVCPKVCLLTVPWPLWGCGREAIDDQIEGNDWPNPLDS